MRATPLEAKYIPEPNSGCWLWTGTLDRYGYGQINIKGVSKRAHRIVFETVRGPIPAGLTLDHTCRMRCCVNPDHLEIVTNRENLKRGNSPSALCGRQTHCKHGHPFDAENTRVQTLKKGFQRTCRVCARARNLKKARAKVHALIVRASFANPYHWGWHRYLWAEGRRRGVML